ncbi:FAD-binding oxidoreductase [Spirillospora sp. NPDC049024]
MTATDPAARTAVVTPRDPRYEDLLDAYNHRFSARPREIRVAVSAADVAAALRDAAGSGARIAARSGGHCFEGFASAADLAVLLDVSQLDGVAYDPARRAFAVGAGARLGPVYRALHARWGVTIPAGTCFDVGMGGHVAAGGYGHLSRRDGLVVDHLYAVEAVVVDAGGEPRVVTATREPDDPHRDLWWAHTGGGGGNFGVVTRYWFRSPDADSADPARLLPAAPGRVLRRTVVWPWEPVDDKALTRLVRNFCDWHEDNSAPGSPAAPLWSNLILGHRSAGAITLTSVVDEAAPGAAELLDEQYARLTGGVGVVPAVDDRAVQPWMSGWMPSYNWPPEPLGRYKNKAAYLRRGFDDRQLEVVCSYLGGDGGNPFACLVLSGYGCRIAEVPSGDTAAAHRTPVLKAMFCGGQWTSPDEDGPRIDWIRRFYRDVYAHTGGVPVPDAVSDGSYIGYPDVDLADPEWNTSGVPWHDLYYGGNYPRLQRVKERYDPLGVFRHGLSVRPPA